MFRLKHIKEVLTSALVIIGLIVLTSCHDDNSGNSVPDPVQKTILMYLPFTGGDSPDLYGDLKENISAVETYIAENKGIGDNKFLIYVSPDTLKSYLIELKFKKYIVKRDTIETYTHPENTTVEGLTYIFNKVKSVAPASIYSLLIGSHGEGWIPAKTRSALKTRYWGSGTKGYQTDVTTLAQAINNAGIHMQYILFDACYMSCIENMYDLRSCTDYVIASTSEIMSAGLPYTAICPYLLQKEPDYYNIISEFASYYSSSYGTLAVINTSYMDDMVSLMQEINNSYTITEEQLAKVQDLDGVHRDPTVYFDFADYVDKMLPQDEDYANNLRNRYKNLMQKLVPNHTHTQYILCTGTNENNNRITQTQIINTFSGVTISDPSTYKDAIDTKTLTNWWKATH